MHATALELAGLSAVVVSDRPATEPMTTVVLLHGFGAPGDDLVSLAEVIQAPVRWVFPAAPIELGGLYGDARAWWRLDLAQLEDELRRGVPRDRRTEVPPDLHAAREALSRFLDQLEAGYAIDRLILGGFSQGAMLALDVALHRSAPPAALVLMSATLLAEGEWMPRMATLKDVPVLLSHGRADQLLAFGVAEDLRDRLRDAGAKVEWLAFAGAHEIPMVVIAAVTTFLARQRIA